MRRKKAVISKNETNRQYYLALVLGGLLIAGIFYIQTIVKRESAAAAAEGKIEAKKAADNGVAIAEVQFDFGNGYKRRFSGDVYQGVMLSDVVNAAAETGDIEVFWERGGVSVADARHNVSKRTVRVYKDSQMVSGDARSMSVDGSVEIELRAQ